MPSFRNFRNVSSYDASGNQLDYVDSETAHRLCADGSHEWRCVSCGKTKGEGPCTGINHLMAVFEVELDIEDDTQLKKRPESDRSLTLQDMQRNVGITEDTDRNPTALIRQSRTRIRNWARASVQNRAITIVPASAL